MEMASLITQIVIHKVESIYVPVYTSTVGAPPIPPVTGFISEWKTDNAGTSNNNQIALPLESVGTYNFNVNWGDGNDDDITVWNQSETTHTYPADGTYTVTITGAITGFRFNNGGDKEKILDISEFGPLNLGNSGGYFYGCSNLILTATDELDLVGTTILLDGFRACSSLTTAPSMALWDTSNVITLQQTFHSCTLFNQDISSWNTGSVNTLLLCFFNCSAFNQAIGSWNVSSVTSLASALRGASSFNQPLDSWNVGNVTTIAEILRDATIFNQPLNSWNVSNVLNMSTAFRSASAFNQPLNNWVVSSVTNMGGMFQSSSFNQDISSWDVSSVLSMGSMFVATPFNQPLNSWNVSSVTNMSFMFFVNSSFNRPLNSWVVSNVTNMSQMLRAATSFDQDISNWNVISVTNFSNFLLSAGISTTNYDALLIDWEALTLQNSVSFHGGNSQYSAGIAATARGDIITNSSWTFIDGGQVPSFISDWTTDNTGTSNDDQITLPLESGGTYNFNVDWGDSNQDTITAFDDAAVTHTYAATGTYTVIITGTISGWRFNNGGDKAKILDISSFGPLNLGSSNGYFYGCSNLTLTATDELDLTGTTTFLNAFRGCSSLTTAPSMALWDTSNITDMGFAFFLCSLFNQPLNSWNVSSVENMLSMFQGTSYNQPLNSWVVSSVENMGSMFASCPFNQAINSWNVSSVTQMSFMFIQNSVFNQPLSSWVVSSVTEMRGMFESATAFDQDISNWNVISVTNFTDFLLSAGISTTNYSALLIQWEQLTLQNGLTFQGGSSQYSVGAATTAKEDIETNFSWTFFDGGQA